MKAAVRGHGGVSRLPQGVCLSPARTANRDPRRIAASRDCRRRRGIVWESGHRRGHGGPLPRQGPVAQWLEPAAHNGLVGGSSPPGPTTQSHVWGNFPAAGEKPPEGGMRRERLVSGTLDLFWEGSLGALFSGLEFRFPGNGDCGSQRPVRLSCFRRSKAENLALPGPFGRHVAEARHSHPTR